MSILLASLPRPDLLTTPEFETVLAELKALTVALGPELAEVLELESEPAVKVLQVAAHAIVTLRAEVNDHLRGVMLAYASGAALDHLGALYGVARRVIVPADPDAVPPVPAEMEGDDEFRARIQLAPEALTTAGPAGAYRAHALAADPDVLDAAIDSPEPGTVRVTLLSRTGFGIPTPEVSARVAAALDGATVRPLTDTVLVEPALVETWAISAQVVAEPWADPAALPAQLHDAARAYADAVFGLGRAPSPSGVYAALHRPGVATVTLSAPLAWPEAGPRRAALCTDITVEVLP